MKYEGGDLWVHLSAARVVVSLARAEQGGADEDALDFSKPNMWGAVSIFLSSSCSMASEGAGLGLKFIAPLLSVHSSMRSFFFRYLRQSGVCA